MHSLIEDDIVKRASALHATSAAEATALMDWGVPVINVPLGVRSLGYGQRNVEYDLLFYGRLASKKGLDLLLEALSVIPDATLRVVGPSTPSALERYTLLASRLGVSNRVVFDPPVFSDDDRKDVFASARLLVLPTKNENFGLSVYEAVGAGLPVISSEHLEGGEDLIQAGLLRIGPLDRLGLAEVIRAGLQDLQWQTNAARLGPKFISERFSWARSAQLVGAAYAKFAQS